MESKTAKDHYLVGRDYFNKKEFDKALEAFTKAVESDPGFGPAFTELGITADLKGDREKAVYYFKKAVELKPSVLNYTNLCIAVRKKEGPKAAAEIIEKAYQDLTQKEEVFKVSDEYALMKNMLCRCGRQYTSEDLSKQMLKKIGDKEYDILAIKCPKCQTERELKFRVKVH